MELKRTLTKRMQKLSGMRKKDSDSDTASLASQSTGVIPDSIELPAKSFTPQSTATPAGSAPGTPVTPGSEKEFLSIPFDQASPVPPPPSSPRRSSRPSLASVRTSRSGSIISPAPVSAEPDGGTRIFPNRSPGRSSRSRSSSGAGTIASAAASTGTAAGPVQSPGSAVLLPALTMPDPEARRGSGSGSGNGVPLSPTSIHNEQFDEVAADEIAQSILEKVQNERDSQRWSL